MKPIEFKEQNIVFGKGQKQHQLLPAFRSTEGTGKVISCWNLSFKERVKLLFTGKLWLSLCMFGQPLTPSFLSVNKEDVLIDTSKLKSNEKRT